MLRHKCLLGTCILTHSGIHIYIYTVSIYVCIATVPRLSFCINSYSPVFSFLFVLYPQVFFPLIFPCKGLLHSSASFFFQVPPRNV